MVEVPLFYIEAIVEFMEGKYNPKFPVQIVKDKIKVWQVVEFNVVESKHFCGMPAKYHIGLLIFDLPSKAELEQAISYLILCGK